MSDYIQFEGGSFLKSFVASHPTEDAFIETSNDTGYKHWLEDDPNREKKLRVLYGRVTKTAHVAPAPEATSEVSPEDQETADLLSQVTGSKVEVTKKKKG